MRGLSAWRKWSGMLAVADSRDFERKVLPFLRLTWPSMQQAPATGNWDRKGIDLLVWKDSGYLPCVVQCKGFKVQELGSEQIRQTEKSIDSFYNSNVLCDFYILVHNREGKHKDFNERVNERLRKLVANGKAKKAELWDRQTLLKRAFDRMKNILNTGLRENSRHLLDHFQSLFEFGNYHISEVPIIEKELIFKRGEPCLCEELRSVNSCDISRFLLSSCKTRWTLLAGRFGTGKTTAVLHAATESDRVILFVPCAKLPSSFLVTSTNVLLEESIKSLRILDDFDDQDREVLYELSGPVLSRLIRQPESPYALVLDGLDENRRYTNLTGLQYLSNQLADFTCPIVMTTRTEHLFAMFGDFSLAFYEFSAKKGPQRNARLLELVDWNKEQILQLVEQVLAKVKGIEKNRLSEFKRSIINGQYIELYGDLPLNPLFLQFILEDIANQGIRRADRSLLLFSWFRRKIHRDKATVGRASPSRIIDTEEFTDRMMRVMENVAHLMTCRIGNTYELSEFVDSSCVKEQAERVFGISEDGLLGILLNSVLVPESLRRGSNLNITFAFRVFQEYFLAAYLVRENLADEGYSSNVRSFCKELRSHIQTSPDTNLAAHFIRGTTF